MSELLNILLAFAIGSIPFGIILTRAAGLGDIRAIGSGNIGATNVLRTGHTKLAAATLLLDALKGVAAILLARHVLDAEAGIAAFAAVAGHCFSPWLGFKGGKGVATSLGGLLALSFPAGLVACIVWLCVFFVSRISSLSALAAIAIAPFAVWLSAGILDGTMALLITALVCYRHQSNIARLARGLEPKSEFGRKV